VPDQAAEFEWRAEGEGAEVVIFAPDAESAERNLPRALPAARLPGVESPVHAAAFGPHLPATRSLPSERFGLVALSRTHAAPGLVGQPERGLLLVASTPASALKVPPEDLPRLLRRRLSEAAPPSLDAAGTRALAEGGALWAAEAGLVEEEDLPHLMPPSGVSSEADPDALGRQAVLAGVRDWARPGRVEAFSVAEVFDSDGGGALGLEPDVFVISVLAGAEDLGRLGLAVHADRISSRVRAGADFGSTPDLPAAPLDSEEARDLVAASAAASNYAVGRAALLLYALRRVLAGLTGAIEPRAGWEVGGTSATKDSATHRSGLAAVGEGEAITSGGVVAAGTGTMRGSAPPFGVPLMEDGRWPPEEAGLLARWAGLAPIGPRPEG